MEYLSCDCGSDNFFRIIAFPIDKDSPEIVIAERGIKCVKCEKVLSAGEVKQRLGK